MRAGRRRRGGSPATLLRAGAAGFPEAVRTHWPLCTLLVIGAVMRMMEMVAYPPALFFGDSWGYVVTAFSGHALGFVPVAISGIRPSGYPFLLWLFTLPGRHVVELVALQHVAGLLTGTLVYAALVRAAVPRAVAGGAAALVILDGYLMTLEQYVMPEAFFILTLLLAVLALAWRAPTFASPARPESRLSYRAAVIGGLLLAAGALQRTAGTFVIVPIAAYLLWDRPGWRRVVAFALALAIPLLSYAAAEDARSGTFGLSHTSGWILYGRVAGFASCRGAGIARNATPLCETAAVRHSHPDAPTWYIFASSSPADRLFGGNVESAANQQHANAVLGAFARSIVLHQPLDYVGAVAADLIRYFTPGATPFDDASSATSLPKRASDELTVEGVRRRFLPGVNIRVRSPAGLVRDYRGVVHVPRPVLALLALTALAGIAFRVPSRREVLLFAGSGVALLLGSAATAGFGLRYLIPAVPLLTIGGTLAARDLLVERRWLAPRGGLVSRCDHCASGRPRDR